ncbi:MAG: hypothetical protein JJU02_02500 [Cryomorphaceae bacterium]|nr:hypothetical protein [Cryomorphaceae bacterium]
MELHVFRHIEDLDSLAWNAILSDEDVFHQHRFLQLLQNAQVENADMRFLAFYKSGELLGSSVISIFTIDVSLFANRDKGIQFIKRIFPNLFRIRICFCGIPLSAGQSNIRWKNESDATEITQMTLAYMEEVCAREKIKYCVSKEHKDDHGSWVYLQNDYLKVPSLPGVSMALNFNSVEDYLSSLRAPYRRQIMSGWKKLQNEEPTFVEDYFQSGYPETAPVFTCVSGNSVNSDDFFEKYISVISRAESRLETLNVDFFRAFFKEYHASVCVLCMVYKGDVLGMFALMEQDGILRFLWTAKSDDKDAFDTYGNLLSATVVLGIQKGMQHLDLGQTAYYPKMRLGASGYPLHLYFRARLRWQQALIKRFKHTLFPEYPLPVLRVFRSKTIQL